MIELLLLCGFHYPSKILFAKFYSKFIQTRHFKIKTPTILSFYFCLSMQHRCHTHTQLETCLLACEMTFKGLSPLKQHFLQSVFVLPQARQIIILLLPFYLQRKTSLPKRLYPRIRLQSFSFTERGDYYPKNSIAKTSFEYGTLLWQAGSVYSLKNTFW